MSSVIPRGPYRATRLWNEVISLFRAGMPLKKHRQLFKLHHDCFTGYDAVNWLHQLLTKNANFGPHVSRKHTFLLLNKFLKNHVIEDTQGQWGKETFTDNGQLFRFPIKPTPKKLSRDALSPIDYDIDLRKSQKSTSNPTNEKKESSDLKENSNFKQGKSKVYCNLASTEDFWKSTFLSCLKRVLHLQENDDIIKSMKINVDWLKHNTLNLDKSGLVSVSVDEEMPCWVVSAMKCLSDWPDNCDGGFPNYEGFEKDVFKAIVEYFESLNEPLLTFQLFNTFTAIMTRCDMLDQTCNGARHSVAIEKGPPHETSNNECDRIHKQLLQAQMRYENLASRRQRRFKKINKKLFPDENSNRFRRPFPERNDISAQFGSRRVQRGRFLGDLEEMGGRPTSIKRHGHLACGSAGGNVGSLPDLSVCEEVAKNPRYLSTVQNFKSESDLLYCQEPNRLQAIVDDDGDDDGDDVDVNDIYSSVEDLLLDMSASTEMEVDTDPPGGARAKSIDNPTYHLRFDHKDSSRRREGPSSSSQDRIRMLDGFTRNPLRINRPQSCFGPPPPSDPFHVYHNTSNSAAKSRVRVDDYVTLPWHYERKRSFSSRMTSIRADPNLASVYEREVARSKSDIIERREVPPPGMLKMRSASDTDSRKYAPLPKHTAPIDFPQPQKNSSTPFHRLSRSHSNLTRLKLTEKYSFPNNILNEPPTYHRSMNVLNDAGRFKGDVAAQSPLSAALQQARVNFKSMVLQKIEATHSKEAFQLCLLLLPPSKRRYLHLLLRLMTKMVENPRLSSLHDRLPIRSLLIERFTNSVIRTSVDEDCLSRSQSEKVMEFLLDHASTVIKIHQEFDLEMKRKLEVKTGLKVKNENTATEMAKPVLRKQFTFCKQVTRDEYESQNGSNLDKALTDLLQAIVNDRSISHRDKRKKLKQFQKTHPRIYAAEFPFADPLANEKKPRLNGAFKKLRNLRL